jgi:ankyrin repeat protein
LWSENDLNGVNTTRNKSKSFTLIASDKLTDKFQELDARGSVQISVLLGMVEPKGSAVYLMRKNRHFQETGIHVRCHYLSAVKEFTMEQLDEEKIRFLDIARNGNKGTATHVVTKIQYGADATFTLTKRFEKDEDEQKASNKLNKCAVKLMEALRNTIVTVDGNLSGTNDVACHFATDFNLPDDVNAPTTYQQAMEFITKLKQFPLFDWMAKDAAADPAQLLGVPVTVWLHPLALMPGCDEIKLAPLYEMSPSLASQCIQMMEKYEKVADELHYMLQDPLARSLSPFLKKLELVQQHLTASLTELKMKLRESVVDIRSGKTQQKDSFAQLLSEMDSELRVFNCNRLNRWLGQKHKELCVVKRFQEEVIKRIGNQSKVLFFPSAKTLREQMSKIPVEIGFEISFSSLARPESFLESLDRRITEEKRKDLNDELWCENNSVFKRIQKEIVIFAELVNAKSDDKKFSFAITAPDGYDDICATQFSIKVQNQQERIFGWDAVLKVCQNYPKERIVDVFQLVFEHFEKRKFIDVISLLVEKKITEEWNPFPLLALCRYYDKENLIDIVRMLIEKKVDPSCEILSKERFSLRVLSLYPFRIKRRNALLILCKYYNKDNLIDIVRMLIEKNIDVNCKTIEGWNALLLLCRYYKNENLIDIVRFLIEKNIDVNCITDDGLNALHLVCEYHKKENLIDIVRLLIEKNIDVNCKDDDGRNALHFVCQSYQNENLINIVRLLIKKNIDVNCKDDYRWNALHTVCRYYHQENLIDIVRFLIQKNIDVNCQSKYGWNALLLLCQNYHKDNLIDVVQFLIDKNIDVNCMHDGGWNALHYLCDRAPKRGLVDLVQLLIQHNIDKNVMTGSGSRKFLTDLFSLHYVRETPRSLLLKRFNEDKVRDVLQILDS